MIFYRYLNQSTLVLGCGNITYTEEDDPVNDFFISDGHIMNGSGKFDEHVGAGYFDWKTLSLLVLYCFYITRM